MNADENPDLATANNNSNTVSVLLGTGDGTFATNADFGTGSGPYSIAVGDLNADGKLDLLTANNASNTVSVLMGNGDGTFATKSDFATGLGPSSVAIGDLNADGNLDVVAANSGSNTASVLLGNGDGTFGTNVDFATGLGPSSVAIGDLNADGKPDLATANKSSSTVSVLLGNGDGTFATKADFGTGDNATFVAIGDLNADAKPDLALAVNYYLCDCDEYGNCECHFQGAVSVLLGNGDGTFGVSNDFVVDGYLTSIVIGDLNEDEVLDLVVARQLTVSDLYNSYGSNTVSVLLGNGDGTFGAKTDFTTGYQPTSVAIADLNADGRPDLASADAGDNTVSVLLGNGNGTFGAKTDLDAAASYSAAIGDLNGDGIADLVEANYLLNTVSVLLGNGDGTFRAKRDFGTWLQPSSVVVGDFNGDGKPDLATACNSTYYGTDTGRISVLSGNGDGTFATKADFQTDGESYCVVIGDLNADGKLDLVTTNYVHNSVSVLLGHGDGTFAPKMDVLLGVVNGTPPNSVAIGDLNSDGKLDLALTNRDSDAVTILWGYGDGTFRGRYDIGMINGPGPPIAIVDLNADGKLDLVTTNNASLSVLLGNGDGTFGTKVDFATGFGSYSIAIGDLNADGKVDLVAAKATPNSVSVLLGNGDGTFAAKTDFGTGLYPHSVAIGLLNADSKPDIVTAGSDLSVLWNVGSSVVTGVDAQPKAEETGVPRVLQLKPAYPNPFGTRAQFNFGVPRAGLVRLAVYDVQGRRVALLVNQAQGPGWRSVVWDGRDQRGRGVASGAYFARLESGGEVRVRKIVVAR